jgi:hypothetical protein
MNRNQVGHERRINAGCAMLNPLQQLADNGKDFAFVTSMGINRNILGHPPHFLHPPQSSPQYVEVPPNIEAE